MVPETEKPEAYSFLDVTSIEGRRLILAPLTESDLIFLGKTLVSDTTWFTKTRGLSTPEKFADYFRPMIERRKTGEAMTLVVRLAQDIPPGEKSSGGKRGETVATSTFQYPTPGFLKIEIGFTWVADNWHRTFVNTEMKYLMLKHAFEVMGAKRVEFSVHPKNPKSNAAMLRIGAKLEGTLRKWRFLPGANGVGDDGNRNMYSIIDDEWPEISARLSFHM